MKRRFEAGGLPIITMVDAFVGGLSIILIMVIVSQPSAANSDVEPQADVKLVCEGRIGPIGIYAAGPEGERLGEAADPREVPGLLTELALTDGLTLKTVIHATPDHLRCLGRIRSELALANQDRGGADADLRAPIFIDDVAFDPLAPDE